MPPKLIIEIAGDTRNLEKAFKRTTKESAQFTKGMKNLGRGSVSATASLAGLRRTVLSTSAGFLGGVGVVAALKSTVDAAMEAQRVLGQTENAVRRSGLSWAEYGKRIQAAALAQSNLSGFDDERLLGTFSNLLRSTNDVNEALRLNALATDVARGRNIELEQATQLVVKASQGNAGALRRVGIAAAKGSTAVQLLDLLQKKFAGSAAAYGKTAAGAQDRFRIAIQNLQETVGAELLPVITKYLNIGANWLNQSENQKRIAKDLHEILHDVGVAANIVKGAFDALSKATGGTRNALFLLASAFAALKLRAAIAALTQTAFATSAIGAAATGSAARVGGLRLALSRLGALGLITVGIDLIINRKGVDKAVSGFLDRHGLPGGTNKLTLQQTVALAQGNGFGSAGARAALRSRAGQTALRKNGLLVGPPAPARSVGVPGRVSGTAFIHIENFHSSAPNIRALEEELTKRARSRPARRRS